MSYLISSLAVFMAAGLFIGGEFVLLLKVNDVSVCGVGGYSRRVAFD